MRTVHLHLTEAEATALHTGLSHLNVNYLGLTDRRTLDQLKTELNPYAFVRPPRARQTTTTTTTVVTTAVHTH